MKRLLDALAVSLVVAVRHWLRVAAVALCVPTFLCGAQSAGAGWPGYAVNALLGLGFGVILAFGDELADVLDGK